MAQEQWKVGDLKTSYEIRSKKQLHQLCSLLNYSYIIIYYSILSLLNNYAVFPSQTRRYCIPMKQSVVSKM